MSDWDKVLAIGGMLLEFVQIIVVAAVVAVLLGLAGSWMYSKVNQKRLGINKGWFRREVERMKGGRES